ncbi:pentatricopeptide repeat-containing protein At1g80150, mitochondrial-like [Chenopodium quinoa]|uniref:pentatricopeptide repeat-containing protein At1g80150, mitochondrial-like n=1 Tax=Chenopodium quinoa TaxID=63459 RepID=UPI000B78CF87|nr:pentatricopeptide repeat-containing protein At1g80150, mitochondrial-like [Chenopodium quinoa]XP_021735539.1 pentatricopeptide repeat-containing protein At1g80150, mitochondrial-like [Chenopodium quinoa]XP_021735540.1 pentatricopeptide repeat-containing protein At1g80150, mitochondrial-like [Chenopodium quinoa]
MIQRFCLSFRPIRRFSVVGRNLSCSPFNAIDTPTISNSSSCVSSNHDINSGSNCSVNADSRIKPKLEEPALIKLKKERDPDKLFKLFKDNAHNRLVIENKYAFEDTVSRLAGARRYDYIEHLLEHQKSLPQGRREGFIVRIIMLYGRAGMVKQAVDTFYNMHLFGCKRTVKSVNAALKVLSQTRDLGAINLFLMKVPQEFGVQLDVISVNIVINAFCGMGILDKAYLVMVEMEKAGIKPDVVSYTTLISSFYKYGRWEIGNGLWNLMAYKGCYPNIATFNARIQFLVSRGRAWEANDLLGLMENLEMQPDEVTYNLVIKGFCRAGFFDMAKRIFSALHGRGYKANAKIYQTMVHYLCMAGDFNCAYLMCKECMKKNWTPNVDTICTLLKGLKSIGELDKAAMIFYLAQRRHPPFPARQLDAFKAILARS